MSPLRGSPCRLVVAAVAVALLFPGASGWAAEPETGLTLDGTWYVLAHYRDRDDGEPDRDYWDDRVWTFDRDGRRLTWTEYPVVVFQNPKGRFEQVGADRMVRTLSRWQPDADQRAEIASGLEVNPNDVRSKTLRGTPKRGYEGGGDLRAQSTSVIGYSEHWTIDGLLERPVFARTSTMGAGRTENLQDRTRFSVEEVLDDGARLRGRFERDGHLEGSFEMRRAGEVRSVDGRRIERERRREHGGIP